MENSFKQTIDSAQNILILLPKGPYFDQVAAGLALYLSMKAEKNVSISCPSEMTVEFNKLVGVDKISKELGDKNLVIRFKDYEAQNIERVAYDIENQEFKLSVIPKPDFTPPTREQINVSYSGLSADLIILIGGANESHFPILAKPESSSAKLMHIGIFELAPNDKNITSLVKTSSSTSELVGGYIKEVVGKFSPDVASNLLAGLHEGSKNFTSSYVSAETFKLAGELMEAGGGYRKELRTKEYTARDFGQKEPEKTNNSEQESEDTDTPKAWLEPKIYKGTSAS